MSAEVLAHKAITVEELEVSLVKAMKEITTTMFNCDSEIISTDQVEIILPGSQPSSDSVGKYPDS